MEFFVLSFLKLNLLQVSNTREDTRIFPHSILGFVNLCDFWGHTNLYGVMQKIVQPFSNFLLLLYLLLFNMHNFCCFLYHHIKLNIHSKIKEKK